MMTVCMFPIHQIISFWTFWSLKLWQFMAKMRMLQKNIAKSSDSFFFFFHEFENLKSWMGSKHPNSSLELISLKAMNGQVCGVYIIISFCLYSIHYCMSYWWSQNWDPLVNNCIYKTLGCNLNCAENDNCVPY